MKTIEIQIGKNNSDSETAWKLKSQTSIGYCSILSNAFIEIHFGF